MGPSSRDRMIGFAGTHQLPLDGEHPVWAKCTGLIAAAAHGALIELEQRAATADPLATASDDDAAEVAPSDAPPTEKAVLKAVTKLGPTIAGKLAAKLGCTVKAMSPVLAKLVKQGLVLTEGTHRSKQYSAAPAPAEQAAPSAAERQAELPLDVAPSTAAEPPPFTDEPVPANEPAPEQALPAPASAIEYTEQPTVERKRRRTVIEKPAAPAAEEQSETQV